MALVQLSQVSIAFGGPPLLDAVDLVIEPGDRACLVGRNGEGKSTLLRILNGELEPDGGAVTFAPGVRVAALPQQVPQALDGTVRDIVSAGLRNAVHHDDEEHGPRRVARLLSLLGLSADDAFGTLSGGSKRRVLLARALAAEPDALLLDEPTNHLDIDTIEWLEGFLKRHLKTFLFVTHDRMFLRRLATRIIDLDRGQLNDWRCDYDTFLRRKQEFLDDEAVRNRRFDKKLTKEEAWIRQGIKARRTRDEGRVRALEQMRRERAARRAGTGTANLTLQEADPSGRLVIKAEHVDFAYEGAPVIRDLTTTVLRGDKVGIIGPNGCGKTTLLRLLLGPHALSAEARDAVAPRALDHRTFTFEITKADAGGLQPQGGTLRRGTRLQVAYFDQHRHTLDDNATAFENIGKGRDSVTINGQPRNVYGYLQEFLFSPDRARTAVRVLSGGERNRLLLARLFAEPANLLVMDEPTNDLDAETLDLLEERLVAFSGTLLLVSHDREFLNNVVTSTLVFEGDGQVREYVGGYDDWMRQRPSPPAAAVKPVRQPAARPAAAVSRLTSEERRELRALPRRIEKLEAEQAHVHAVLADPATYKLPGTEIARATERAKTLDATLQAAYTRWELLESRGR